MSDPGSARLLTAAIATLREQILPEVQGEVAKLQVDHVTRLLRNVAATLSQREAGLREFLPSAAALAQADGAVDGDLARLEARRVELEAAICARLPELVRRAGRDAAAVAELRNVLATERRFYISQDPDVARGSSVVYRGGRIEDAPTDASAQAAAAMDADSLTAYLRRRAGRDDVSASEVRQIPGGFSKATIFFTLEDAADGSRQPLVIRKDLPIPLIEKTVVDEFPRLGRLFERGYPVAEPLWLEVDASLFGGAFIVSRRVAGSNDTSRWASDPARGQAACRQLAVLLAKLHAYTPVELGFSEADANLSAGVWMEREVAHWTQLFHNQRKEAFPLQEMPLLWLAQNIPAALYERPARMVHGDVGFHNLMFDDAGEVTALLDWEFSVLGDPTQDLCFVRQFVEGLIPWPDFLQAYRQAGGAAPCEEAEFFYRLWTKTRNAVGCVHAQTLFDTAMPGEMRFALAGHVFAPYMFVDQCETLIEHLAGQAPRS